MIVIVKHPRAVLHAQMNKSQWLNTHINKISVSLNKTVISARMQRERVKNLLANQKYGSQFV